MKVSTITAYPLQWPHGWPRAKHPECSRFKTTFAVARDSLFAELRRMKTSKVVLSTNIQLRQDGIPYANRRQPDDRGVAVYFEYKGKPMTFACDRWLTVAENIQAIKKTIEALRGIDRWGASDMIERAFTGFVQIADHTTADWWVVLEVNKDDDFKTVNRAYTRMRIKSHPDKLTGSEEKFIQVKEAYQKFLTERGISA